MRPRPLTTVPCRLRGRHRQTRRAMAHGGSRAMPDRREAAREYYPPPESRGGWRCLTDPDEIRARAGLDSHTLDLAQQAQEFLHGGDSWSIVIIRHGYLVRECYTFNVLIPTRFDIWSGTKSFTGTAWGLLLEDSRQQRLPHRQQVDLDSPAYAYIPDGHPLSDP